MHKFNLSGPEIPAVLSGEEALCLCFCHPQVPVSLFSLITLSLVIFRSEFAAIVRSRFVFLFLLLTYYYYYFYYGGKNGWTALGKI